MRIFVYLAILSSVCLTDLAAQDHRAAMAAAAQVPLSFEQASSGNTRWIARGNGYQLAVGGSGIEARVGSEFLRVRFVGADTKAPSTGLDKLPGKVNYFVGNDPTRWRHDIPTYARVRYQGVYPGTDIVWYGNHGRLEYDLMLQPGADASRIAMRFEGARKLSTESNGDLRVEMARGSLILKQPEVYQRGRGGRERVAGSYELRGSNEVHFRVAPYDKSRPLVIDPTLVYATYFGNINTTIRAVAVDNSGNLYIGGCTDGYLPGAGALEMGLTGVAKAFVTKFDPTGSTVLYSTFLGGSNPDCASVIAVDTEGNVVATGQTSSSDFPLVNPFQATFLGPQNPFVFKLDPTGRSLVYSTYLNMAGRDTAYAVAMDGSGNAYITGYAESGFPTTAGALNTGNTFAVKLSSAGTETYAAAIDADLGSAIAVDGQGAAYIAGYTMRTSFPGNPPGAKRTNLGEHAFVAKLSPDASSLIWATFFGASTFEFANAIALGRDGTVYFGGYTSSPDLPVTSGAIQATFGGGTYDTFVASVSADGGSFGFVTYLGGSRDETLISLAVADNGLIVAGTTYSRDFPVAAAVQPEIGSGPYTFLKRAAVPKV